MLTILEGYLFNKFTDSKKHPLPSEKRTYIKLFHLRKLIILVGGLLHQSCITESEPLLLLIREKNYVLCYTKRACAAARETRPVKRSSESARHKISTRSQWSENFW